MSRIPERKPDLPTHCPVYIEAPDAQMARFYARLSWRGVKDIRRTGFRSGNVKLYLVIPYPGKGESTSMHIHDVENEGYQMPGEDNILARFPYGRPSVQTALPGWSYQAGL